MTERRCPAVPVCEQVGVLGAGMMGAAIAYATAKAGIDVVLLELSPEAAEKGKEHAHGREQKAVARGETTEERSQALLERIHPTADPADFSGVDIVIEAVSESVSGKPRVSPEVQATVSPVHVFSAADGMPLVEIIRGESTGDEALARTFDFVQQIRKTPIVVTNSRGFFTSRVIGARLAEAVAAVGEGVEPASVEQAALQAGYPAGALHLLDELSLSLGQKMRVAARAATEAAGANWVAHPSEAVVDWMVDDAKRRGRAARRGFYDYDERGERVRIWPGLRERFDSGRTRVALVDLQERMLFAEALEAIHCLDEGVLASVADANIGSIYGIGFPAWTGGVLQYVNQYEGGLPGFVARARELADAFGERFVPPASLWKRAEAGQDFRRE
ncbi:3-hydroxyacyl-CoA dehydrogenase family protein [Microbacterium sp. zg-YB36]|uniref:3-hydroxyacyl-CoA dehydrogenase family protein n=1 Tax=Microbacterium sp. zg-YB36 TaxID=2969407 RepID=UPI00256F7192|nr:3-hydroxyacyl-CoA dehydrogenase family protein [Microbacterium sp. zg-YB36]MDL5351840.1 3-hydroxyacyl-CoA dehydrogenase family protein [Microbacterium sp. zg-YB36]